MFLLTWMKKHGGFTLVELLIALAIIIIIAGVAIPQFVNFLERAKVDAAKAEIEAMGSAVREVKKDSGYYVENLDQLGDASSPGEDFSPWWGPYVSSLPADIKDPWGTTYIYLFWDRQGSKREPHPGNYPPGPPGGGWEVGGKEGWNDKPLPPGLWKKLGGLTSPPKEGFLLFSGGPDKELATADDIEYRTY